MVVGFVVGLGVDWMVWWFSLLGNFLFLMLIVWGWLSGLGCWFGGVGVVDFGVFVGMEFWFSMFVILVIVVFIWFGLMWWCCVFGCGYSKFFVGFWMLMIVNCRDVLSVMDLVNFRMWIRGWFR